MFEALRDGMFLLCGILIVSLLVHIAHVLDRAERITERVNANVVSQLSKPLSVTISQEHPIGVAIDNDVINTKVQK